MQSRAVGGVGQDDPSRLPLPGITAIARDVRDGIVTVRSAADTMQLGDRRGSRFIRRNPVLGSRGVGEIAQRDEENGAEDDPDGVRQPPPSRRWGLSHGAYNNRGMDAIDPDKEVERILREQRELPAEIDPDTPLTEYGIDSLDALNVLFAIEETFGIAIPDDRARAIRTRREMVETIRELTASP